MQSVPLPTSENPKSTQSVQLDGQTYELTFTWSARTDTWTMDIATSDGLALAEGLLLAPGVDLLQTVTPEDRPGGALVVANQGYITPNLEGINSSYLIYVTAEELENAEPIQ